MGSLSRTSYRGAHADQGGLVPSSFAQRTISLLLAVGLAAGLALMPASPASAADPKTGKFRYYTPDPDNPPAIKDGIFFSVGEDRGDKIVLGGLAWISDACGRFVVPSSLPVSAKGKAKFKGTAEQSPGSGSLEVKVKIKFTKKSKATVTVRDLDPDVDCGALVGVVAKHYT
jgi:hypothetical protein